MKSEAEFYFDGIRMNLDIAKYSRGKLETLSNNIFLGANNRGNIPSKSTGKTITNFFKGSIDKIRIYNRKLNSREIHHLSRS